MSFPISIKFSGQKNIFLPKFFLGAKKNRTHDKGQNVLVPKKMFNLLYKHSNPGLISCKLRPNLASFAHLRIFGLDESHMSKIIPFGDAQLLHPKKEFKKLCLGLQELGTI